MSDAALVERFLSNVSPEPTTGCWLWTRSLNHGYGSIEMNGKRWRAHRASWLLFKGPLPDDLLVCHKCDVPWCVNPEHLFLGTHSDNLLDLSRKGLYWSSRRLAANESRSRVQREVPCCKYGHPRTPENLVPRRRQGWTSCRICKQKRDRQYRAVARALVPAPGSDPGATTKEG